MKRTVYIEIDNILADISKAAGQALGKFKDEPSWQTKRVWALPLADIEKLAAVENFYLNIPFYEEARALISLISNEKFVNTFDVKLIDTNVPNSLMFSYDTFREQRKEWVAKNFGNIEIVEMYHLDLEKAVTNRPDSATAVRENIQIEELFTKSRTSLDIVKPGDILIDFKPSTLFQWFNAGGTSIFHAGDFEKTTLYLSQALTMDKNNKVYFNPISNNNNVGHTLT